MAEVRTLPAVDGAFDSEGLLRAPVLAGRELDGFSDPGEDAVELPVSAFAHGAPNPAHVAVARPRATARAPIVPTLVSVDPRRWEIGRSWGWKLCCRR